QLRAWYGQGYVNTLKLFGYTELTAVDKIAGNMLFLLFSALLFWLSKKKKLSKAGLALGIFLIINLAISSRIWFYIKRVMPFFPVTFIFLSVLYRDSVSAVNSDKIKLYIKRTLAVVIIILISVQAFNQSRFLLKLRSDILNHGVAENSKDLDRILPEGSTIYMHCYAFRFFWQTRHRIISADDQVMNNQLILDKAVKERAKFLLLSKRGGPLSVSKGYRLRMLREYLTNVSESGYSDYYRLYEVIYDQ
ncbi:MAG: hypothetical protein ABH843_00430, partial [Candidatus Omnitrophota bacterium]